MLQYAAQCAMLISKGGVEYGDKKCQCECASGTGYQGAGGGHPGKTGCVYFGVHQYDLPAGDPAQGIPFPVTVPTMPKTRDAMTDAEFNAMMAEGMRQVKAGESVPMDEAFDTILERLG